MQDDAEQQGKAPDRVEGMQAFRLLLDIRHGRPPRNGNEGIGRCNLPAGQIRSCRIVKFG